MKFLKVNNWEEFQHYKDRNPPWIKLYNTLLSDYEYTCLQDDSRLLLIMIYLIASQTNNKIPYDEQWIKNKAMLDTDVDLKPLVDAGFLTVMQDDSDLIADRKQDDIPEQSRDRAETEQSRERSLTANGHWQESLTEEDRFLAKVKDVYQQIKTVPYPIRPEEAKKLLALREDYENEHILTMWQYFLQNIGKYKTKNNGSASVHWFIAKVPDIIDDLHTAVESVQDIPEPGSL